MFLLSIIIPVYNGEKCIKKAIGSCMNLVDCELEIVVIDDGSQDSTVSIVRELIKTDSRIRLYAEGRLGGVSKARNKGIEISKGEYISFLDADDYLDPLFFQYFSKDIVDSLFIGCGYYYEKISGKVIRTENGDSINLGYVWGKIFRRSILEINNIRFNEELHLQEDLLFNLEYLSACGQYKSIKKPLYHYVKQSGSLSKAYAPNYDLTQQLLNKEFVNVNKKYPQIAKKWNIDAGLDYLLVTVMRHYNDCGRNTPLTKRERIEKLREYNKDSILMEQILITKTKSPLLFVFCFCMRFKLYALLDMIFYLKKRL